MNSIRSRAGRGPCQGVGSAAARRAAPPSPRPLQWLLPLALLAGAPAARAADDPDFTVENMNLHGQATYVWQRKPAFNAPYSGDTSLSPLQERSYSFTSTAFIGLRVAPSTELYFNPEVVQGLPLSRLQGLGGLTNGELQKTAGTSPLLYRARLFVRHTWGLGGGTE